MGFFLFLFLIIIIFIAIKLIRNKRKHSIAFFYPNCLEKTPKDLIHWNIVNAISQCSHSYGYSLELITSHGTYEQIKDFVFENYSINIPSDLQIILTPQSTNLACKSQNPKDLLAYGFQSLKLFFISLYNHLPKIYIDTYGVPFVAPLLSLFGVKTISYITVPFYSLSELLQSSKIPPHEGKSIFTKEFLKYIWNFYLSALTFFLYSFSSFFYTYIFTNCESSIKKLKPIFGYNNSRFQILSPPYDIDQYTKFSLSKRERGLVISFGRTCSQSHLKFQLDIIKAAILQCPQIHLIIIGKVDNTLDPEAQMEIHKVFDAIQNQIEYEKLPIVLLNDPDNDEITTCLKRAQICIHTQENNSISLDIITALASGVIPVTQNIEGASDILKGCDECLVDDENLIEGYAKKICQNLDMPDEKKEALRGKVAKFTHSSFDDQIATKLQFLMCQNQENDKSENNSQ